MKRSITRNRQLFLIAGVALCALQANPLEAANCGPTFSAPTSYSSGGQPGLSVADVRNSGSLDIVGVNENASLVTLLLNNGSGVFSAGTSFATGGYPHNIAVADLNHDGKLDVITSSQSENAVDVFLGDGTGNFTEKGSYGPLDNPVYIAIGDVNRDGNPDLIVGDASNSNGTTVSVLLGNGDGSFQSPVNTAVGNYPLGIALADLNHDGKLDIAVANQADSTVSVLFGNGDGTFALHGTYSVGSGPVGIAIADLQNNGSQEIITTNENASTITVLRPLTNTWTWSGTRQPNRQDFPTGSYPTDIAVADLTHDGKLDVLTANNDSNNVSIFMGNGGWRYFSCTATVPTLSAPYSITTRDVNRDGKIDIITGSPNWSNPAASAVGVLLQN